MTQAGQRLDLRQRIRGVFYGWWLVGLSGLVVSISSIPLFHALSIWSVVLERHFGWTRTQLSLAFVFTRAEGGLMGPLEGHLTSRFGARRMVLVGLLVTGAGLLLFGRVQNLWMFYLAFLVMAMGHSLASWIPVMTALTNWFRRRRATAIAWTNVINRGAVLLLIPVIAWAVDPDADRVGWEVTATVLGVFALLVALPISRGVRNRPEDYGQRPDGDSAEPPPTVVVPGEARPTMAKAEEPDFTVRQALRTPAFWLIGMGHAFVSMLMSVVMAHLALMLSDQGIGVQMAAWVLSVHTATVLVFQLVGGYIGDRVPKNLAIFVFSVIQGLSVFAITLSHSLPHGLRIRCNPWHRAWWPQPSVHRHSWRLLREGRHSPRSWASLRSPLTSSTWRRPYLLGSIATAGVTTTCPLTSWPSSASWGRSFSLWRKNRWSPRPPVGPGEEAVRDTGGPTAIDPARPDDGACSTAGGL